MYVLFVVFHGVVYLYSSFYVIFFVLLLIWVNQFRRCKPQLLQSIIECSYLYSSCTTFDENKYEFFSSWKLKKWERPLSSGEIMWFRGGLWSLWIWVCSWTLCNNMIPYTNSYLTPNKNTLRCTNTELVYFCACKWQHKCVNWSHIFDLNFSCLYLDFWPKVFCSIHWGFGCTAFTVLVWKLYN